MQRTISRVAAFALLAISAAAQATLFDLAGTTSDYYGRHCALVGDLNGDGFGEFVTSAPSAEAGALTDAGWVRVYSGADGAPLATFFGESTNDQLGFGLSAAGDVNADGVPDLCVGVPFDDVPGIGADAGSVRIHSGRDGSVLHRFFGQAAHDQFGFSTAPFGDLDRDGFDDVLIGTLNDSAGGTRPLAGAITVFSGRDGSVLRHVFGERTGQIGTLVAGLGDLNGDGAPEFAGALVFDMVIFSGATGAGLWRQGIGVGGVFAGGLDANGDGFGDYITGSPGAANGGRVQLVSGRDFSVLREHRGGVTGNELGASVVVTGDIDGDGTADYAAGMPGHDTPTAANVGAVRVWSGRTGAELYTLAGDFVRNRLGEWLGGGRDVNGDGVPDVITSSTTSARARVLSLVPRGLEPFGTGTPGCLGSSTLLANGVPTLGNAGFALHAASTGGSPLLLVGDSASTAGVRRFRGLFHLDPSPPPPAVGLLLTRPLPAPDARGSLVAPFPLPSDPSLLGRTFVLQVASLFPAGSCRQVLTTSRGLRLTVQ